MADAALWGLEATLVSGSEARAVEQRWAERAEYLGSARVDDRVEPAAASQFPSPSGNRLASSLATRPRMSWPKQAPTAATCPLGLDLAAQNGIDLTFVRATSLPRCPVAYKVGCAACLVARSIEPYAAQQHEDMHGGIPPAAAPPHRPSVAWRLSRPARAPLVATRERSAATSSACEPIRSRITCQQIEGSESSSHCMTGLAVFGACQIGRFIVDPY